MQMRQKPSVWVSKDEVDDCVQHLHCSHRDVKPVRLDLQLLTLLQEDVCLATAERVGHVVAGSIAVGVVKAGAEASHLRATFQPLEDKLHGRRRGAIAVQHEHR